MCPPEQRIPQDHPLRAIRWWITFCVTYPESSTALYAAIGRPSIPQERLLRGQLLQIFYTIRSERLLMEQLDYNLLFRWFVSLPMDEPRVGANSVHEESRPAVQSADRPQLFPPRGQAGRRPDVRRALHGRWDLDRSVGQSEEFPAEGRRHRWGWQQLPGPGAQ
jgi:hypothetical protein